MSYVYIRSEPGLFTVGFYRPDGEFETDSDHTEQNAARERVHYLNGGAREVIITSAKNDEFILPCPSVECEFYDEKSKTKCSFESFRQCPWYREYSKTIKQSEEGKS